MKTWEELRDEVRGVSSDKETAISILKMIEVRLDAITRFDKELHTSLIVEGFYEVIKELLTALMAVDGQDTDSHEAKIAYLAQFYSEFDEYELHFLDDLRKIRNRISYKGFFVNKGYLERNELEIKHIIKKLKELVDKKIKNEA